MTTRRTFWRGFAAGALTVILLVAAWAGGVILVAKHRIDERWEAHEQKLAKRTQPLLRAPELPAAGEGPILGEISYDWELLTLDGDEVSAERFRDRVLLVDFWATWCAPCVDALPGFGRLHEELLDEERIALLLITDEEADRVEDFVDDQGFEELPIYRVRDGVPSAIHPGVGRPVTFLVDCAGRVVHRHAGGADWGDPSVLESLRSQVALTCDV